MILADSACGRIPVRILAPKGVDYIPRSKEIHAKTLSLYTSSFQSTVAVFYLAVSVSQDGCPPILNNCMTACYGETFYSTPMYFQSRELFTSASHNTPLFDNALFVSPRRESCQG